MINFYSSGTRSLKSGLAANQRETAWQILTFFSKRVNTLRSTQNVVLCRVTP